MGVFILGLPLAFLEGVAIELARRRNASPTALTVIGVGVAALAWAVLALLRDADLVVEFGYGAVHRDTPKWIMPLRVSAYYVLSAMVPFVASAVLLCRGLEYRRRWAQSHASPGAV